MKPAPLTRSEFERWAKERQLMPSMVEELLVTIEAGFAPEPHTPGPWRMQGRRHSGGYTVVADNPTGHDNPDTVRAYGGYLVAESVTERNVHLITAAPDLLEALESIENDDGSIPESAWEMRNDAIAKARGRYEGIEF